MKNILTYKLYETPDEVFNQKYRDEDLDSGVFDNAMGYMSDDALTFGYNVAESSDRLESKTQIYVGEMGKKSTHGDLGGRGGFSGRIWYKRKIITFWNYPENNEELMQVLKDIDKEYEIVFDKDLGIYKDRKDWKIETGYDYEEDKDNMSILIPVTEYKNDDDGWSIEQKMKAHFDPKEKERFQMEEQGRRREKIKNGEELEDKPYGSGKQAKSIKNADSVMSTGKMTYAQSEWWKKQESHVLTFETYNIYTMADTSTMNNVPVVDYVSQDYFDYDVEMDEKEPPNATGRDDREVKNKTKKAVSKYSVS